MFFAKKKKREKFFTDLSRDLKKYKGKISGRISTTNFHIIFTSRMLRADDRDDRPDHLFTFRGEPDVELFKIIVIVILVLVNIIRQYTKILMFSFFQFDMIHSFPKISSVYFDVSYFVVRLIGFELTEPKIEMAETYCPISSSYIFSMGFKSKRARGKNNT